MRRKPWSLPGSERNRSRKARRVRRRQEWAQGLIWFRLTPVQLDKFMAISRKLLRHLDEYGAVEVPIGVMAGYPMYAGTVSPPSGGSVVLGTLGPL